MKKSWIVALAVLTALSLCAAGAFAEAAQAPNEADAVEFNHKVYEANQLDALFGRHESVAYTFTFPLDPENPWFVWETSDRVYQEWGANGARLDRDRIVYSMSCDAETGALDAGCGVDYDPDYDPFYSFVWQTEEAFFDPEHDHVTRIDEQDGVIHTVSEFDETLSRQYIENELGMEYAGQTVRTELFLDAETCELLKSVETMVQDGEETVACVLAAEYDTPEPLACRTLRAPFERASENMMTMTFVIDPGADHEIKREITVPANTEASQMFGEAPIVYFNDADCETLSHWDRMSDRSFYIFTDPDEELTAKFQTLYDKVIQEMQDPGPDSATFGALVAANTGSAILSRHTSFGITRSTFQGGKEIFTETSYRDADTYFWGFSDGRALLRKADLWVDREAKDGDFSYVETIFDSEEATREAFAFALDSAPVLLPETETLLETVDAGDGRFVAVTRESDPETIAWSLSQVLSAGGYEYAEGMTLRYEYAFDAQTQDLLSIHTELTDAEGETLMTQEDSCAYDVEAYDPFAEGEPFAGYEAAATDPEQNRTITVVFDPDTDNERGVEYVTPRHAHFNVFLNGQYVEQIYTDRECTQPFEGSDGVSDLVLYVK